MLKESRFFAGLLLACVLLTGMAYGGSEEISMPNLPSPMAGLNALPFLTNARTRSVCAENPTGEKGKGGMAIPNPSESKPAASARAARAENVARPKMQR